MKGTNLKLSDLPAEEGHAHPVIPSSDSVGHRVPDSVGHRVQHSSSQPSRHQAHPVFESSSTSLSRFLTPQAAGRQARIAKHLPRLFGDI